MTATLDELHSSLEEHVEEASLLVVEAERVERIAATHDALMASVDTLRRETLALRQTVRENRDRLSALRSRMKALLPPGR